MALKAWGKVVMGGYPIGQGAIMFIVESDSEEELHEILEGLPLSEVAEAKVTPLRSFEELPRVDGKDLDHTIPPTFLEHPFPTLG